MTDPSTATARIGLIGLGTMGAALAANIAEKGFPIAVWNRTTEVTRRFHAQAGALADRIIPTESPAQLVAAIAAPRTIILMVPAGAAVDEQIAALAPLLSPDDLIVDAGNANFHDTNRRAAAGLPMRFLGMGISGGEEGARHGPAIMGGGARADWDRIAPIMQAIAARAEDGTPCASWMGEAGAGHFVKMVHNGIEYADMQMIAEVYGVMRDGLGLSAGRIAEHFADWNRGALQSYLIEISARVAAARDPYGDGPMLDAILDAAGQKGTGRWTAVEAQHLAAPIPVIEAAVMARNVSARIGERAAGQARFGAGAQGFVIAPALLEQALIAGKILCYAQGFAMIEAAGRAFGWQLDLPGIARVWRAGCIIRSAMLNDMAAALAQDPGRNLMMAPHFAGLLERTTPALRQLLAQGILHAHPLPALGAGLAWFDMMRTARGTANLIQAQRDYFGAHGFERLDGQDHHHGPWARDA
ncbi:MULTISPECIES: NADP-dependent phosphogluconate dehydrogenase [unclassified Paracoccus (in: a-proteobacteria)]|uniref:NADP-dependent phosphogluconate dehydrogenase n=1 Tax=unclassified Paracoccus (in: a-proteobacteria) TaxID=2688777 RepID=UPI0012B194B0|nr:MULTISPECIES: NADP-dependent phosphogluconate dehydrogenase [unclassified Paracoccus (in: a-proteobacteria)]UXU75521.1 NADP-dependent phosphogluconate dehydrogenase [Paracoccus sp. SMMA_5]UXU81426.1 NADP-dependent phosphogluconate dehydrogenase [Paracoccus sp. SMMA_5_TC]